MRISFEQDLISLSAWRQEKKPLGSGLATGLYPDVMGKSFALVALIFVIANRHARGINKKTFRQAMELLIWLFVRLCKIEEEGICKSSVLGVKYIAGEGD